tara:strand:+ start:1156 stop:1377 length:222 start_codon:yes stop_codon:yes gene_type:complete
MVRNFISQIDGAEILCRWNSEYENLEIKLDGCDWSDFIPQDKRAYSNEQYKELIFVYNSYVKDYNLSEEHITF